ncbi:solute carrier family 22 member 18 isoform X7 [Sagmatias obliquidens]|nr:solute carrier family 22 member 18 isoform X7 [Lagenorhynchus obliquidens]XP_026945984.1 solute carrier family 22 member 18 isoform X7 [Lagenorhynchus obliquidens]XP_026945985.1 solute carrier family 22 member 18 isoform X7 [Lagenorhynchus obliquidens]
MREVRASRGQGRSPSRTGTLDLSRVMLLVYVLAALELACLFMQFSVMPYLSRRLGLDSVAFGYQQTIFGVLQLLGGPVFGRFADQRGARAAFTLSFLASSALYLLLAVACSPALPGVPLLFASRLPGALMHTLPAAQMAITDLSAPEERPAALGRLGLCFGVGVIFGSLLGGTLSSTCGIQCPVIVALVVSLLGAVLSFTCIPTSTKGASARAQAALPGKPKASVFDLKAITCLLLQPGVLPVFLVKVICGFPSAVAWGGPARDNLGEGSRWSSLSRSPRPSPWHRDGHLTGGAGVGTTAQPRPLTPDPPPRPGLFMVMFSLISMDFFQLEAAQAGYLMSFFGVLQMAARSGPSCSAGVGPPRHRAQPRPDPSPRGCCSKPTAPRALPVCLVEVAGDQVFQGLVIGWLSSRFSEGALLRASVLAFSVVGLAMALMANVFHLCLLMPGLVFSLCALNVVTDSMLTNAVSASDTGTMLGLCASVQPLTRTLGPTLGGLLYHRFGVPVFGHVQLAVNFLVLLVLWRQPVPPKMDKAW